MNQNSVTIEFTNDEALVLFDFLTRFEREERLTIEHQAESVALWNCLASLERVLNEPFQSTYADRLHHARRQLTAE